MTEGKSIQHDKVEQFVPYIGDFGRYQKLLCLVLAVLDFPISMQATFGYFATLTPEWRCVRNSTECLFNGTFSGADERRCNFGPDEWYYIKGKDYSLTTQYGLHCSKKFLSTLIMSIFFIGWGLGAVVIGWIADRHGRKRVIMPCVIVTFVLGFISPFIPNVYVLVLFRFIMGFAFPGVLVQTAILLTEYVGNDMRPYAKVLPGVAINMSWMAVAVKSYLVQNWKYLSMICTAPYVFVLLFHFVIPESARWLHLQNRSDEAMDVLHNIAKWNKKEIPPHVTLTSSTHITVHKPKSNASLLFKTKALRRKSFVQIFLWMNAALLGYGLQFAAKSLGGSFYFNFIILAAMGLPATCIAAFVNRRFGRKISTVGHLLVGSIMCLSIACIPRNIKVVKVILGIVGKMCGTASFFSLYLWAAEMYPTNIRAVAMGVMQVSARIGSAMSPWVVLELGVFGEWVPFLVIGLVSLVGSSLGCLLTDTKGTVLEDSVDPDPGNDANATELVQESI